MLRIAAMLLPALVTIYTGNYAVWCWRRRLMRGAVGLALLAAACVGLPVYVIFVQRP